MNAILTISAVTIVILLVIMAYDYAKKVQDPRLAYPNTLLLAVTQHTNL